MKIKEITEAVVGQASPVPSQQKKKAAQKKVEQLAKITKPNQRYK